MNVEKINEIVRSIDYLLEQIFQGDINSEYEYRLRADIEILLYQIDKQQEEINDEQEEEINRLRADNLVLREDYEHAKTRQTTLEDKIAALETDNLYLKERYADIKEKFNNAYKQQAAW